MESMYLRTPLEGRLKSKGKWISPYVPKRGWICIGLEDLDEPQQVCEMCESETIRYVHYMEHSHYPEVLKVGCVCAGHLEENASEATIREKPLKQRAQKRKNWVSLKSWKNVPYGACKESGVFWVVVKKRDQGWITEIYALYWSELVYRSASIFETMEEAELDSFNYLYPSKIMFNPLGSKNYAVLLAADRIL